MACPCSAWLLLSFSPFPVRHPVRWSLYVPRASIGFRSLAPDGFHRGLHFPLTSEAGGRGRGRGCYLRGQERERDKTQGKEKRARKQHSENTLCRRKVPWELEGLTRARYQSTYQTCGVLSGVKTHGQALEKRTGFLLLYS